MSCVTGCGLKRSSSTFVKRQMAKALHWTEHSSTVCRAQQGLREAPKRLDPCSQASASAVTTKARPKSLHHQIVQQQQQQQMPKMGGGAAPLPPGWQEAVDPASGKTYYMNHISKETAWDRPV
mmetsp:Transcript_17286/g.27732  ORF Transcript_17286/g.27732 Transcript_17286/m.27732 type:complete len:123 (-) Transcript_17286:3-371(-)